jgi:hypothetical protein
MDKQLSGGPQEWPTYKVRGANITQDRAQGNQTVSSAGSPPGGAVVAARLSPLESPAAGKAHTRALKTLRNLASFGQLELK